MRRRPGIPPWMRLACAAGFLGCVAGRPVADAPRPVTPAVETVATPSPSVRLARVEDTAVNTVPAVAVAPPEPVVSLDDRALELLARMSHDQKVGQLMMVGFGGTTVDPSIVELVRGRQVGGVCMFKRNIVAAEQIALLNDQIRALMADTVPPFIAVDQEGGNVVRIQDGAVVLPGNMALGATRSAELAYEAGFAQAEDLKLLGFNMNLAPVLDVNLNPKNPVIGIRSFGDDAQAVTELGLEFVRGQQDANIATVAKHFPGHGSTDADSHRALPVMTETYDEVMGQLAPFRAAIAEGLDGLMTAHVAVPALTADRTPATISKEILDGLLRRRMGFDGLVLTDELEMEAIARSYGVGRAAVLAIQAGADMVLIPWRVEKKTEVYQALMAATRDGRISRERLDDAVRRILVLKLRRGIFEAPAPVGERLAALRGGDRPDIAAQIARQSVTLLRSDARILPLRAGIRVGVVTAEASLVHGLLRRLPEVKGMIVPAYPSLASRPELRERARKLALEVDVVVVGVINSRQLELVATVAAHRPVIVVSMGLPYLVEQVPEAKAVMALYSYRDVSADAAAAVLTGERGTPGRLPVSLRRYRRGFGLDLVGGSATQQAAR